VYQRRCSTAIARGQGFSAIEALSAPTRAHFAGEQVSDIAALLIVPWTLWALSERFALYRALEAVRDRFEALVDARMLR
jgi:hypothetical protein